MIPHKLFPVQASLKCSTNKRYWVCNKVY